MTKMLVRTLAVITVAVVLPLTYAAAASADAAEGFSDPDDVSPIHALLVLGGIPLAVIIVLALATYVPAIVRGESVAPAGARAEDQWFGGRRDAQQSAQKALQSRSTEADADTEAGGASGSW